MSFRYGFFFAHATKYDKVRPFETIPIIVVFFFFFFFAAGTAVFDGPVILEIGFTI